MKKFAILGALAVLSGFATQASATTIVVDDAELAKYFTPAEIAQYKALMGIMQKQASDSSDDANRLLDAGHNRCGNDVLPVANCPPMQEFAWNGGAGCINATEYDYARTHAIAPICSPLARTAFLGWCRCGCLEKSTAVYTFDSVTGIGFDKVVDAITTADLVYAMTEEGTVDEPAFSARALYATTAGSEANELVWVKLADGTTLGLTEEHAVLLSTGEMTRAIDLVVGTHELVSQYGEFVGVESITRAPTQDQVYNVLTDAGLSHKGHMIIANGIIVGDIMWQNTLATDLMKVVARM